MSSCFWTDRVGVDEPGCTVGGGDVMHLQMYVYVDEDCIESDEYYTYPCVYQFANIDINGVPLGPDGLPGVLYIDMDGAGNIVYVFWHEDRNAYIVQYMRDYSNWPDDWIANARSFTVGEYNAFARYDNEGPWSPLSVKISGTIMEQVHYTLHDEQPDGYTAYELFTAVLVPASLAGANTLEVLGGWEEPVSAVGSFTRQNSSFFSVVLDVSCPNNYAFVLPARGPRLLAHINHCLG